MDKFSVYQECKTCLEIKYKVCVGQFGDGRLKYGDSKGLIWNGNECPQCKFCPKLIPQGKEVRFCRVCKEKLPKDLYFKHRECRRSDYNEVVDWGNTGRGICDFDIEIASPHPKSRNGYSIV